MRRILAFIILSSIKIFSKVFFRGQFTWLDEVPKNPWQKIRLVLLLNHTSLYEPLFIQVLPFSYLWYISGNLNIPGADVTLKRPIVGTFWKLMFPNIVPISRKKDSTWETYLKNIKHTDVVMLAPEGRMKRLNGLDKYGKKMTVRGGVADIIEEMNEGVMLIGLSGGLHHIQSPGQLFPRPFRKIVINLSYIDIKKYKASFRGSPRERKLNMTRDLQERLEKDCPATSMNRWQNTLQEELG